MNTAQTMVEDAHARARALARDGVLAHRRGDHLVARTAFDRSLELRPTSAWTLARRSEAALALADRHAALCDLSRALELRPDYAWALAHRGALLRELGRHAEARVDLERALAHQPDYAWAYVHRGQLAIADRRYDDALADLERALALEPTIIAHVEGERALLLNYLGRFAEAIACCESATTNDPDDHIAWYSLAVARACHGGRAQAQADIERARVSARARLHGPAHDEAIYRLAGLDALEGLSAEALAALPAVLAASAENRELVRHDPAWTQLRRTPQYRDMRAPWDARLLARSAEAHRARGDYHRALAEFDRSLALRPNHAWTLAHRGVCLRRLTHYERALADLDRALELRPDYAWARAYRGVVHTLLRRYEHGLSDLEAAIATAPELAPAWACERSVPLLGLGRFAEGITVLRGALAHDDSRSVALYLLVVALARGREAGCVAASSHVDTLEARLRARLVASGGDDPSFFAYASGGLAAVAEREQDALEHLARAIAQDPVVNIEMADHDPAWDRLRTHPHFIELITPQHGHTHTATSRFGA